MFCPDCGSILTPKKVDGKKIMACSCGYTSEKDTKVKDTNLKKDAKVEVVDKNVEIHPIIDIECPKCGHGKAYFMTMQTRAGDEPETKFYKCEKCAATWRDYS